MIPCDCNVCVAASGGSASDMTMRDYFAAMAMAALISKTPLTDGIPGGEDEAATTVAAGAYDYAKAMLRERAK